MVTELTANMREAVKRRAAIHKLRTQGRADQEGHTETSDLLRRHGVEE